jgi:Holliday junction resolvasome RuvABC endonuclease subunit
MKILALDLSLTRTGFATPARSGVLVPPKGQDRGVRRLAWFRLQVRALVMEMHADLVVMEGYSFGSPAGQSHSHALGELGGVVRLEVFDHRVPFVEIAPKSLKKYATGKGNAAKAAVLGAAIRRLGYAGDDDNEADALWLRTMAFDHYGLGAPALPELHRQALQVIEWPLSRAVAQVG